MVHSGIFATSDEIMVMAGENYDTGITEARINALCLQAESVINAATRYNWSDAYAALNADKKGILSHAEACFVAWHIIAFNPSGYTNIEEATFMTDLLWSNFQRDIKLLEDQNIQVFVKAA